MSPLNGWKAERVHSSDPMHKGGDRLKFSGRNVESGKLGGPGGG